MAISADGNTLYVSQYTSPGAVTVVNLANGYGSQTIPVSEYPQGIALSPDGTQLWVAAGEIDRIDTTSNTLLSPVAEGKSCGALAFTPDGKKVYASARLGNILVVSTSTGKVTNKIPMSPVQFYVSPWIVIKGHYAYALFDVSHNPYVQGRGRLVRIDTATDQIVNTVKFKFSFGGVPLPAFLPNTPYLYIPKVGPSYYTSGVTLFDTRTQSVVQDGVTFGYAQNIAIAPNGTHAYATGVVNTVTVVGIQ